MKLTIKISSILLLLIGLAHIGFSFIEYSVISIDALWFVGGGLIFIFSGLFNLFLHSNADLKLKNVFYLKTVNLLSVVFLVFLVIQLPMIPGFIGLGCSVFLLFINHCR